VLIFLFPCRTPFPPPRATARSRPPLSRHYRGRMEKRKAKERGRRRWPRSSSVINILRPRNSAAVASRRGRVMKTGSRASRLASRGIGAARLGDAVSFLGMNHVEERAASDRIVPSWSLRIASARPRARLSSLRLAQWFASRRYDHGGECRLAE